MSYSNEIKAVDALDEIFNSKNVAGLKYFNPSFVRHNPTALKNGTSELEGALLVGAFNKIVYTPGRAISNGDYVVVHGKYENYPVDGITSIVFDMFRFNDCGDIVEHWDVTQTDPGVLNGAGNPMWDKP